MDTIELIDNYDSVELYIDSSMNLAKTSTECAEFMTKRNNNILLKYVVSGTILFAAPTYINAKNIVSSENIQNLDYYLQSYNDCIELPYNQYLKGVNEISSVSNFNNKDIIKDIISFKTLNNKWDGYGAIPLEVESATNAILLMHLVGDLFTKRLKDFYPNPYGTISFNWENESEETISLEIGNMQMSYYVELNSSEVVYRNNIDINAKEASKLSDFISIL
jgi:hypothetical protein